MFKIEKSNMIYHTYQIIWLLPALAFLLYSPLLRHFVSNQGVFEFDSHPLISQTAQQCFPNHGKSLQAIKQSFTKFQVIYDSWIKKKNIHDSLELVHNDYNLSLNSCIIFLDSGFGLADKDSWFEKHNSLGFIFPNHAAALVWFQHAIMVRNSTCLFNHECIFPFTRAGSQPHGHTVDKVILY